MLVKTAKSRKIVPQRSFKIIYAGKLGPLMLVLVSSF